MLDDSKAKLLATSIKSWLDFQILCKREVLLSEAYLAQPIGEFLRSHFTEEIVSEWNHPQISQPNRGRPRQVDYVLKSRDIGRALAGIEAKWIGDTPVSKQRILNDVLRLECLKSEDGNSMKRYFMVAGRAGKLSDNCFDLGYHTGNGGTRNFTDQILHFGEGSGRTEVRSCKDNLRDFYSSFQDSYNIKLPVSYKSSRVSDEMGVKSRAVIWRVKSVAGRSEFSPEHYWDTEPPSVESEC